MAAIGAASALIWPATYWSEGKILVQSQQIPTDLVRPTVTNAAQERIQVIEQRLMTRDNLVAIVDKFQMFPDKRNLMSVTQLVEIDEAKDNDRDASTSNSLLHSGARTIPRSCLRWALRILILPSASRVANELVTRILNEDIRDRTNRASDTTKFLKREVERLQAENAAMEAKIAQAKQAQLTLKFSQRELIRSTQLKADYLQKSALYSEKHPCDEGFEAADRCSGKNRSADPRIGRARCVAVATGGHSEKLGSGHCKILSRPARRSP